MKFKRNCTLTPLLFFLTIYTSVIPACTLIFGVIIGTEIFEGSLVMLILLLFISVAFIIIFNIINLIILIFIKHDLFLHKDRIVYTANEVKLEGISIPSEREIKYEDVGFIVVKYGYIKRYSSGEPTRLEIYDKYNDLVMEINNPSFIASLIILKRCKSADKNIISRKFVIRNAIIYGALAIFYLIYALI